MADDSRTGLLSQDSIQVEEDYQQFQSKPSILGRMVATFNSVFTKHSLAVASGPSAAILVFLLAKFNGIDSLSPTSQTKIGPTLGALVWMAIWWILEPMPIAVTSLLPLVLFPLLQVMDAGDVAAQYMNDTVVLLLGSFILAKAIEKYGLHKRMALKILLVSGGKTMNPRLVLLGFLAGSTFVSMWMANTSAAAMMLPMASGLLLNLKPEAHVEAVQRTKSSAAMAVVAEAEDGMNGKSEVISDDEAEGTDANAAIYRYSQGVIVAVTYGTFLGGLLTTIGSGPNLVLLGIYQEMFPDETGISFLQWMKFSMPLVIPWIIILWLYLCWRYCPKQSKRVIASCLHRDLIEKDYEDMGPISFAELFILADFAILILLWASRSFGDSPGWGVFFGYFPDDGTVAVTIASNFANFAQIAAAIVLFLVPSKKDGDMLMTWKNCQNLSWGVLLLLGGGFALSEAIDVSKTSDWIGLQMDSLANVPYYLLTPVVVIIVSFITEFSSNVATATLFVPIFAEVAVSIDVHPLLLMLPATFATNCAFILPSGTPTTALAIGTGYLNVNSLFHPGMLMHILAVVLMSILVPTLGNYVFGFQLGVSAQPWSLHDHHVFPATLHK